MTTYTWWVVTCATTFHRDGVWKVYPALWHLRDDPPHRTEFILGWTARNGSDHSTFARVSRRTDEETRLPVAVCPACLFSTQLSEGMARHG